MNYLTNDDGDVKVRHENGIEKWIPKHLAENKFLMKGQELTPVEAPVKFEGMAKEFISDVESAIESGELVLEQKQPKAEKSKGGRPSKK
jgi:hypothetical protein